MVFEDCSYNPACDIQAVDQTGFVDLPKAHELGSVPANLQVDELRFNEIEDPNSIVSRPSDSFEAMQTGRALLDRVPKKTPSE